MGFNGPISGSTRPFNIPIGSLVSLRKLSSTIEMISHPYRELIETSYNFVFILFYFMEIRGVGGLEPHVDNSYIDVVSYASI